MDQTKVSKRIFLSKTDGKRNTGKPTLISLEDAENDIRELKITTWREKTDDRKRDIDACSKRDQGI